MGMFARTAEGFGKEYRVAGEAENVLEIWRVAASTYVLRPHLTESVDFNFGRTGGE